DDAMLAGVVRLEVDADGERDVLAFGGRGDQHLLDAAVEVRLGLVGLGEAAGRLDDDVDLVLVPRNLGRIFFGDAGDGLAVDDDLAVGGIDLPRVGAVDRVMPKQVRERARVGDVVDDDELEVAGITGLLPGAYERAPDSAEAVDSDASCHDLFLSSARRTIVL